MSHRTFRVMILHGYSARNRGDGLLVDETVALIREAFGDDTDITLLASDPESFRRLPVSVFCTRPSLRGWKMDYLRQLFRLNRYDLVVGVGGGYLRAGTFSEALKCAIVMGPQLLAAAVTSAPTVYLPQSIGPLRGGTRIPYRILLNRLTQVMLRDDRSVTEMQLRNAVRYPDLAISSPEFTSRRDSDGPPATDIVISVRSIRGSVPAPVKVLSEQLRDAGVPITGYVQSTVGGNDDAQAQQQITPDSALVEDEYLRQGTGQNAPRRVVVAVRLHAALLALRAGHRVIHLAYERKGFSAFADLGLEEWVHNVNSFDPTVVAAQALALRDDPDAGKRYDDLLRSRLPMLSKRHEDLVSDLRHAVGGTDGTSPTPEDPIAHVE